MTHVTLPASSEDMTLLGGWQVATVEGAMGPDAYSPATKAAATHGQVVGQRLAAGSKTSLRAGVQLPADITVEGRALPLKVVCRSADRQVELIVRSPLTFSSAHEPAVPGA